MSKRGRGTREELTALCLLILCDVGEGKSGREGAPRALLLPCVESIVPSLERADPARRDLRGRSARGSGAGDWWHRRRAPRCVGTSRPPELEAVLVEEGQRRPRRTGHMLQGA
jgi:hypothetical protein